MSSSAASVHWSGPLVQQSAAEVCYITLERTAVLLLTEFSKDFHIPIDHVLLAIIGIAYYKSTMEAYNRASRVGKECSPKPSASSLSVEETEQDYPWEFAHPEQWRPYAAKCLGREEYLDHCISSDNIILLDESFLENKDLHVPPFVKDTLKRGILPYRILVPNRDGPHEDELVGNLVVDRAFEISMGESQTFFGAVHAISQIVKNRKWRVPSAVDPWVGDRISMNIRPQIKEVGGSWNGKNGVKQVLSWQKVFGRERPRTRFSEGPLDAFVDENDTGEWVLQMKLVQKHCVAPFHYAKSVWETVNGMCRHPFQKVMTFGNK